MAKKFYLTVWATDLKIYYLKISRFLTNVFAKNRVQIEFIDWIMLDWMIYFCQKQKFTV